MVNVLPLPGSLSTSIAAMMRFHDFVDHREADAGALDAAGPRLLAAVELGEDRGALVSRDADAVVLHGDEHIRRRGGAGRPRPARGSGEYLTALSSRFHTALDSASSSVSIGAAPLP